MKFRTNLKLKSNVIDPVPFVNVIVLFIVFFVLSTQFLGKPGMVINLPNRFTDEHNELFRADCIVVSLQDEKIFLFEREIEIDRLQEELARRSPQVIAIRASQDVSHKRVTEIISLAKNAGIKQIAIANEGRE